MIKLLKAVTPLPAQRTLVVFQHLDRVTQNSLYVPAPGDPVLLGFVGATNTQTNL